MTPQTALDVSGTISAITIRATNLSIAGTISGTSGYYVGTVSAATLSGASITGNNLSIAGTVSANTVNASSSSTTTPSIIMATWPRFSTSNVAWAYGYTAIRGNAIQWPTLSQTMNTNLMTIVNDATVGSVVQILKSGIWLFDWKLITTTNVNESYLLVSSVSSDTTYDAIRSGAIAFGRTEGLGATVKFLGYLQSNTSQYYKFHTFRTGPQCNSFWNLRIAFLGETNSSPTYPI